MATTADLGEALRVERAALDERAIIANLVQFYTYDLDPFADGRPEGQIGADGRYPDEPHLESYWREDGRFPYIFRVEGVVAGFALVNRHFKLLARADWAMAEFFVHRRFQGRNVGRSVAHRIFATHLGRWELSIMKDNRRALEFWRKTITSTPNVRNIVITREEASATGGPIYRFTTV